MRPGWGRLGGVEARSGSIAPAVSWPSDRSFRNRFDTGGLGGEVDPQQLDQAVAGAGHQAGELHGLIVRGPGTGKLTQVLVGLLDDGDFSQFLRRLDDA